VYQVAFEQRKKNGSLLYFVRSRVIKTVKKKTLTLTGEVTAPNFKVTLKADGSWEANRVVFQRRDKTCEYTSVHETKTARFVSESVLEKVDRRVLKRWRSEKRRRSKMIKREIDDKYTDTDLENPNHQRKSKEIANGKFLDLMCLYSIDTLGVVAYLDSSTMNTTRYLMELPHVKVPINFSKDVAEEMIKRGYFDVLPFHGSLLQWLKRLNPEPVLLAGIWLDYCCTFDGNDKCSPKKDMLALLSRKTSSLTGSESTPVLQNNSVVGCTFSLRDARRSGISHVKSIVRIVSWINKTAKSNGWRATPRHTQAYYPAMLCIMYSFHM
jgi:hypothetical protein